VPVAVSKPNSPSGAANMTRASSTSKPPNGAGGRRQAAPSPPSNWARNDWAGRLPRGRRRRADELPNRPRRSDQNGLRGAMRAAFKTRTRAAGHHRGSRGREISSADLTAWRSSAGYGHAVRAGRAAREPDTPERPSSPTAVRLARTTRRRVWVREEGAYNPFSIGDGFVEVKEAAVDTPKTPGFFPSCPP